MYSTNHDLHEQWQKGLAAALHISNRTMPLCLLYRKKQGLVQCKASFLVTSRLSCIWLEATAHKVVPLSFPPSCVFCRPGSLATMETAQDSLVNLGLSFSKTPPLQLAPGQVTTPVQTLQTAVRDALQCQISQLAYADKVCS